jgi:hypothetical protein
MPIWGKTAYELGIKEEMGNREGDGVFLGGTESVVATVATIGLGGGGALFIGGRGRCSGGGAAPLAEPIRGARLE